MSDPRYPIGPFKPVTEKLSVGTRHQLIEQIAEAPQQLRAAVDGLSPSQLETPYREGGWSIRQVTHHLPDSHMNAYVRFKLALTEDRPTIKPYDQVSWAELDDSRLTPVEVSLDLLESLHERWTILLRAIAPADFGREFEHPEEKGILTLDFLLQLYAWHGRHHIGQITSLRKQKGWN